MSANWPPEVFQTVIESMQTGVYLVDRDRRIALWNDGAERITGYLRQEVIGRCCSDNILVHCDQFNKLLCTGACPLAETMRDGEPREAEVYLRHKEGHRVPVLVRAAAIKDAHRAVIGAVECFDDRSIMSEKERRDRKMSACGCLDDTTGLPNRAFTSARLRENLDEFREFHIPFCILRMRVDRLEEFQAIHGKDAVSTILHAVASTLMNTLRPADVVGRWSQDEFLAILTSCGGKAVWKVGERLQGLVASTGISWWGDRLPATVSWGGATAEPGDTVDSMLLRAENEMRRHPSAGAGS